MQDPGCIRQASGEGCTSFVDPDAGLGYLLAADAILLIHILFVCFVVVGLVVIIAGGLLRLSFVRNPWFRIAHLCAIAVVVLQSWLGMMCPLTIWEMALREKAGVAVYEGDFIAHWLQEILYYTAPPWVFLAGYTFFGLLVAATWIWLRPRPLRLSRDD
jgi:hypothetical protein